MRLDDLLNVIDIYEPVVIETPDKYIGEFESDNVPSPYTRYKVVNVMSFADKLNIMVEPYKRK